MHPFTNALTRTHTRIHTHLLHEFMFPVTQVIDRRPYYGNETMARRYSNFHIGNSLCIQIKDMSTEATSAKDFIKGTYDLVSHSR